jgi:hypothetical protein
MPENDDLTPTTLFEFESSMGRPIWSKCFHQEVTYSGMLIGSPSKKVNDFILGNLVRRAKEMFGDFPVIILNADVQVDANGEERLPPIVCVSGFETIAQPGNRNAFLIIVWFEHSIEPRLPERTLDQMRNLDWDKIARDYEM